MSQTIEPILNLYPTLKNASVQSLGSAGGFSGACFWKLSLDLTDGRRLYCLRRWPPYHPTRSRLEWIHQVLAQAWANECYFIPKPLLNQANQTIVENGDYLWEVSPWMAGQADYLAARNPSKLNQMMISLAKFHQSAARICLDFRGSENLASRQKQLLTVTDLVARLKSQATSSNASMFNRAGFLYEKSVNLKSLFIERAIPIAQRLLANQIKPNRKLDSRLSLDSTMKVQLARPVPVQPIIRDIWWDHVLFTGDQVTGLVDFGAMQIDSVAFDIARLLGSCLDRVGTDSELWEMGITAYQRVRPLTEIEHQMIPWIDNTGILLGTANWLVWLWLEERQFEDVDRVHSRIDHLLRRFRSMTA